MTTHHGRRRAFPELAFEVIQSGNDIDRHGRIFDRWKVVGRFPFTLPGYKKARQAYHSAFYGQQGQVAPAGIGGMRLLKNGEVVDYEVIGWQMVPDPFEKDLPQSQTALLTKWGRDVMRRR